MGFASLRSFMSAVNLVNQIPNLNESWQPITVAHFNGNDVIVVKGNGAYAWHVHGDLDDLLMVL